MMIPPSTQDKEWMPEAEWLKRHDGLLQRTQAHQDAQLVFLGDSITEGWNGEGQASWDTLFYQPYHALNLGIGGDEVQHVHWRIINGEGDGISPKIVVILIGTNNIGNSGHKAPEVSDTLHAFIQAVADKWPGAKVLVHTIFPRNAETDHPFRGEIEAVNEDIREWALAGEFELIDLYDLFLEDDGGISTDNMPDLLHLSAVAYAAWAEKLDARIKELL